MMNGAHIHLLLNHIPVLGAVFGVFLLVIAALLRKTDIFRAGLLLMVVAAVACIPTYLTGEPAEDVVEGQPGVTEQFIHPHEEAAEWALITVEIAGVVALAGLVMYRRAERIPGWYIGVSVLIGALATAALARTALLGGEVRHTEIRTGAVAPAKPDGD